MQYKKILLDNLNFEKNIICNGASENFVILFQQQNIAFKLMPLFSKELSEKKKSNVSEIEIKFYELFTKDLKGICDNVVRIASKFALTYDEIKSYIKNYNIDELLSDKKKNKDVDKYRLIDNIINFGGFTGKFIVLVLELCPGNLNSYINFLYIGKINKKIITFNEYSNIIALIELDKIIFQTIFLLATLQDMFPGFRHNDIHLMNILGTFIFYEGEVSNKVYEFKKHKFIVPNKGFNIKLNDFGRSIIANKLIPNNFDIKKLDYDPYDKKKDLFDFFIDLIDNIFFRGNKKTLVPLRNKFISTVNMYFDVKKYYAYKKICPTLDNYTNLSFGNISTSKKLSILLKEPSEYLLDKKYFKMFRVLI